MKKSPLLFLTAAILFSYPAAAEPGLYAYPTVATVKVGAVFGTSPAPKNDTLISAKSPICGHIEIHEMKEIDGIMQMRPVTLLPLPSDGTLVLKPEGYHLMLMDMKHPLKEGQSFPLTLTFKKAGEKTVDVPVLSRRQRPHD